VLLLLLKLGFKKFVRVGCMKKIAKPILAYTAQPKVGSEELKDLNNMLNEEGLNKAEADGTFLTSEAHSLQQ
jgi:hypothetical protein